MTRDEAFAKAQQYGLAIIPQSYGASYRWYVCDIERVVYSGDSVEVFEKSGFWAVAKTIEKAVEKVVKQLEKHNEK